MRTTREAFLERVRHALDAGRRAGATPPLPERAGVGYQGAGDDPAGRFLEHLRAAGGFGYPVASVAAAVEQGLELVRARSARRVLLGRGAFLDTLGLADHLRAAGVDVIAVDQLEEGNRAPLFAADLGLSGAHALIAETGSVVVAARPEEPRSLSLLPPVHIVFAEHTQLVPDLFDLFEGPPRPPSGLTLITGPSKTGDIELRLVTGVHGPGELHVILLRP